MSTGSGGGHVFCTVGTTRFDSLVRAVDQPSFLEDLKILGFRSMTVQIGRGEYKPSCQAPDFASNYYDFKSDLASDIAKASRVISHGGAGTILEVLRQKKHLVVAVNSDLMDNHQLELAKALEELGYLFATAPERLGACITNNDLGALKPYAAADLGLFPALVDDTIGFSNTHGD